MKSIVCDLTDFYGTLCRWFPETFRGRVWNGSKVTSTQDEGEPVHSDALWLPALHWSSLSRSWTESSAKSFREWPSVHRSQRQV